MAVLAEGVAWLQRAMTCTVEAGVFRFRVIASLKAAPWLWVGEAQGRITVHPAVCKVEPDFIQYLRKMFGSERG